ncbi:MAG: deoxycytidylate deaminase [Chloroflexota bacterium]
MQRPDWHQLYITMCYLVGMRSKDPATHVGSVIVDSDNVLVATGYNSLPRGIDPDRAGSRLSRDGGEKYYWMEHAERNAIYNAARRGTQLKGCKIYIPWTPCTDCARAIIQCGISEVFIHQNGQDFYDENTNGKWIESYKKVAAMFLEAGVKVSYLTCDIVVPEVFMNGKIHRAAMELNKGGEEAADPR